MALVACKECKKKIYVGASVCPQCGVQNPGVSYEEERLLREIEFWTEEEVKQQKLYLDYNNRRFSFFFQKEVDKHVALANEAQQKKLKLHKELSELHLRNMK